MKREIVSEFEQYATKKQLVPVVETHTAAAATTNHRAVERGAKPSTHTR
jgi:hypothetical protein